MMFRVITQHEEAGKPPIIEKSPWHTSKEVAEYWADMLRKMGSLVHVESDKEEDTNIKVKAKDTSNDDLAAALAQMA